MTDKLVVSCWFYYNSGYQPVTTSKICKKCLKEYFYDGVRGYYIHENSILHYKECYSDYKLRRAA